MAVMTAECRGGDVRMLVALALAARCSEGRSSLAVVICLGVEIFIVHGVLMSSVRQYDLMRRSITLRQLVAVAVHALPMGHREWPYCSRLA